jgi:broad specificity phosphatase PhoE
MRRKLILIRHSLSEIEPDVPAAKWLLSEEGVARARTFAARVDPGTARCVFTSTEPKAAHTARLLGAPWHLPVEETAGLHEHERPEPRMLPRDQFEDLVRAVFTRPSEVVFGSESADAALERFGSAVMRAIDQTARDAVIVSHGTVIALFVAKHTGTDPFEFWKRQQMPFAVTLALPHLRLEKLTFLTQ